MKCLMSPRRGLEMGNVSSWVDEGLVSVITVNVSVLGVYVSSPSLVLCTARDCRMVGHYTGLDSTIQNYEQNPINSGMTKVWGFLCNLSSIGI